MARGNNETSVTFRAHNEEFNKAIKEMNNESRILKKEFQLVQAQMEQTGTETQKLASHLDYLEKAEAQTAQKAELTRKQLDSVKQTFGENSIEAQKMTEKLLSAEVAHQKLSNQVNTARESLTRQEQNLRDLQTLFQATGTNVDQFADTLGRDLVQAINKGTADSKQLEQAIELVGREALGTETDLNQLRSTLRQMDSGGNLNGVKTDLDKISKSAGTATKQARNLKDELNNLGSGLAAGGAAGAAGAFGIVQGTQDLNTQLARLRTNATMSGRDLGIVEDAFMQITQVTGETDSAVETVSNLLATGFHDNQLAGMIDQINGAAIKFSDTLKTEGIADGIQETFSTGEAIGSFAELLERSGVDLDTFNKGLQQAQEKGQGTTYIMQTMADLGFGSVLSKYNELNPEVQKNAEANAKLQQALADLGIALTPVIMYVTQLVTKFTEWAAQNPQLAQGFTILMGVLGMIGSAIIALMPVFLSLSQGIAAIIVKVTEAGGVINLLRTVFTALTGPIGIVIAIVTGLIAIFVALYQNNEDFRNKVQVIWTSIKNAFEIALKAILSVVKSVMSSVLSFAKEILNKLKTFWDENGKAIVSLVKTAFGQVQSNIKSVMGIIQGIFQAVWPVISGAVQVAWALIKTTIKNALDLILGIIQTFIKIFQGDWKGAFNTIKQTATNIMNNILSTFKGINLKKIGTDMIKGLINGIGSMVGAVKEKIKQIANLIPNGIKDLLDINSPSRVTTELGEETGQGLAIGLDNMKKTVSKYASLLAASAIPTVSAAGLGGIGSQAISENLNMSLANQQPIMINNPVYLDGEEIARNQTPYINNNLGNINNNRMIINGQRRG